MFGRNTYRLLSLSLTNEKKNPDNSYEDKTINKKNIKITHYYNAIECLSGILQVLMDILK
jgi:hypothetical protein